MDRIASIELALKNEKLEQAFYDNEARRSKNVAAESLFEILAADEAHHMERLRVLHDKLVKEGAWPVDVPIEVKGTDIGSCLDDLVAERSSVKIHDDDDIAALNRAIVFETEAAAFYADIASQCNTLKEQRFFRFLANIELEHKASIEQLLSFLQDDI